MNTLTLALRNLLRNRRRSLATLLAMILGSVAVLVFGGYSSNLVYGLQTGFVQSSGHLQIQRKDYFLFGSGNPTAYGIADYERIVAAIRQDPVMQKLVTVVTPSLQLGGIAGNFSAGVSRTVIGSGVVVTDQNAMLQWNDYHFPTRKTRRAALLGTEDDSVLIGKGVARVLQLCAPLHVEHCAAPAPVARASSSATAMPDDLADLSKSSTVSPVAAPPTRIELLVANPNGAPNVMSVNAVKAVDFGVKELDDVSVVMHLPQAQHLVYGNAAPQATAIVIQLQHTSQIPQAQQRLRQLIEAQFGRDQLEIQDYRTLNPFYGQIVTMFGAMFGFIALLIGAIVLFTVSNTMSMVVVERTMEIGTLRAIGLRRGGIRRLFLCEGLMLGIIGAVLGVLISLLVAALINQSGITWLPPGRVERIPLTVRIWGKDALIAGTALGLIGVAVLSAVWPANRAARLQVVDALRHV